MAPRRLIPIPLPPTAPVLERPRTGFSETRPRTGGVGIVLTPSSTSPAVDRALIREAPSARRGSFFRLPRRTRERIIEQQIESIGRDDFADITELKIENNSFVPLTAEGISRIRPEILAVNNFLPIWQPNLIEFNGLTFKTASPLGTLLNFQYQTKELRQETLIALIQNIQNTVLPGIFANVRLDFDNELKSLENDLNLLNNVLANIDIINDSINIKNIPDSYYQILQNNENIRIPRLRDIFTSFMQYSKNQFNNFSETKILLQMLYDYVNTINDYSYRLLDLMDNDRNLDKSVTVLDKTRTVTNGFDFRTADFSSDTTLIIANNIIERFHQSLPDTQDSKIKLLVNILAKEYLISSAIGDRSLLDTLSPYLTNPTGDITTPQKQIFNFIIGNPGNNIFQLPINSTNSLASLLYIDAGLGADNIVLPFENRYIVLDDSRKRFVPGTTYFSDAIIRTDTNQWDIRAYSLFVDNFARTVNNAKNAIYRLLNLEALSPNWFKSDNYDTVSRTSLALLSPMDLYCLCIKKLQNSFDRLKTGENDALNDFSELQSNLIQSLSLLRDAISKTQETYYAGPAERGMDELGYVGPAAVIARRNRLLDNLRNEAANVVTAVFNFQQNLASIGDFFRNVFGLGLLKMASENPIMFKHIFNLTILKGIWAHGVFFEERDNFFVQLVINDYQTIGDLLEDFADRENADIPLYRSTAEEYRSLEIPIRRAIDQYIDTVVAPEIITYINSEWSTRPSEVGNITVPVFRVDSEWISNYLKETLVYSSNVLIETNIFTEIIRSINTIYYSASKGTLRHIFRDGRTKFNGISLSTQFLFLFEVYVQFMKKYSYINIGTISSVDPDLINLSDIKYIAESPRNSLDLVGSAGEAFREQVLNEDLIFVDRTLPRGTTVADRILHSRSSSRYFSLDINMQKYKELYNAFDIIVNTDPTATRNLTDPIQQTELYSDIYSNYDSLRTEFNYIKYVIGTFEAIGKRLSNSQRIIDNFFRQNDLASFLNRSPINNLDIIRYPAQTRLSNLIYNDIKEKYTYANGLVTLPGNSTNYQTDVIGTSLIVSDTVIPSEFNSLVSFLSKNGNFIDNFQPIPTDTNTSEVIQRNNKIITVGVPSGLTKKLADIIQQTTFNRQGSEPKESDVLLIKIQPTDLRFGDIVLKPKSFLVDISLFITKKDMLDLDAQAGERYDILVNRLKISDMQTSILNKYTMTQLLGDERYAFLNSSQIKNIFETTYVSYLLEKYIYCLTGMKMDESTFLSNNLSPVRKLNGSTLTTINSFLSANGIPTINSYTSTEDVLADATYSPLTKDIFRLMTYGSLAFNDSEIRKRVLGPKIFERVYNLPVNLGICEIDVEATNRIRPTILSDIDVLQNIRGDIELGLEDRGRIYLTTLNPNDIIVKDIFINIVGTDTGTGSELIWTESSSTAGGVRSDLVNPAVDSEITRAAEGRFGSADDLGLSERFGR